MKRYLPGRSGGVGLEVKGENPVSSNSVNRVVGVWIDGRVVAKGVTTQAVTAGTVQISVRVPDLRYVEEVLHVEVTHTDPPTTAYGFCNKTIRGNVVDLTIAVVNADTTLTLELIAVGV